MNVDLRGLAGEGCLLKTEGSQHSGFLALLVAGLLWARFSLSELSFPFASCPEDMFLTLDRGTGKKGVCR